jgi:hypothetical protein
VGVGAAFVSDCRRDFVITMTQIVSEYGHTGEHFCRGVSRQCRTGPDGSAKTARFQSFKKPLQIIPVAEVQRKLT